VFLKLIFLHPNKGEAVIVAFVYVLIFIHRKFLFST